MLSCAALLLAGCSSSSPLIPDIFLLSLYYSDYTPHPNTAQVSYASYSEIQSIAGDARLQARVGYFGICINPDGGSWLCSNNATALAQEVSVDQDPLNLIWLASQFKDMVVFPYLVYVHSLILAPNNAERQVRRILRSVSGCNVKLSDLLTFATASLPSSSPSSASSFWPPSLVGTRKRTLLAPSAMLSLSPADPCRKSPSPSSSSRLFSSWSQFSGSTPHQSLPVQSPRISAMVLSDLALVPAPWFLAGSRSRYSSS